MLAARFVLQAIAAMANRRVAEILALTATEREQHYRSCWTSCYEAALRAGSREALAREQADRMERWIRRRVDASAERRRATRKSARGVTTPGALEIPVAIGAARRELQSLQPARRAVKALAGRQFFDLDDAAFVTADCIDGVHAKPAIAYEPC